MVLIIILYINCSITVISSEEDEKIPIGIDNVTVIPETQLDVDVNDFQLVITRCQKKRMRYKELRLQMDEITKGLADNGTDEESSGEF